MLVNKRIIFRWVKVIVLLYAVIGIALYYLQDSFLLHPKKLQSDYKFTFAGKFEEVLIPINGTDSLSLIKFLPSDSLRKGVVIYFHGNMNNVEQYAANATLFTNAGYEVWMPDYPGFGKSIGIISEEKMYEQAMQVKKMADAKFSSDSIIIYGRSLGTGVAAYAAQNIPIKLLVLETPYFSIPELAKRYAFIYPVKQMMHFNFPVYEFLQDVKCPVVIFHGTNDNVIPLSSAIKLNAFLKPNDQFVTLTNAGHNNISSYKEYSFKIDSILAK